MSAPNRIAATFVGGSLDGKWTYLVGNELYHSPLDEIYAIESSVWHSHEDDVLSHLVYKLLEPAWP